MYTKANHPDPSCHSFERVSRNIFTFIADSIRNNTPPFFSTIQQSKSTKYHQTLSSLPAYLRNRTKNLFRILNRHVRVCKPSCSFLDTILIPPPFNRNHGIHTRSIQGPAHRSSSIQFKRTTSRFACFQSSSSDGGWKAFVTPIGSHISSIFDFDTTFLLAPQCFATSTTWTFSTCKPSIFFALSAVKVRWNFTCRGVSEVANGGETMLDGKGRRGEQEGRTARNILDYSKGTMSWKMILGLGRPIH